MDPGNGYAPPCPLPPALYSLVGTLHLALIFLVYHRLSVIHSNPVSNLLFQFTLFLFAPLNPSNPKPPDPSIYQSPIATPLFPHLCPRVCTYSPFRFLFPWLWIPIRPPLIVPSTIYQIVTTTVLVLLVLVCFLFFSFKYLHSVVYEDCFYLSPSRLLRWTGGLYNGYRYTLTCTCDCKKKFPSSRLLSKRDAIRRLLHGLETYHPTISAEFEGVDRRIIKPLIS